MYICTYLPGLIIAVRSTDAIENKDVMKWLGLGVSGGLVDQNGLATMVSARQ